MLMLLFFPVGTFDKNFYWNYRETILARILIISIHIPLLLLRFSIDNGLFSLDILFLFFLCATFATEHTWKLG